MIPMGAGSFLYSQVADENTLVVDPQSPPQAATQGQLRQEVEQYQVYFDMDLRYCRAVEGASQESNLWVARNTDATGLSDVDLQRFKNIAWNECVVKRFLPTQDGNSVLDVGRSMLQIVRNLNLQWRGFEVMGLHPKVEAAEKQIVMMCMEKRLLGYDLDVARIARCLRRCPHFSDHFSNAVGCHIVAKTGHTPGLSKTQYSTDLDYVYKNQGLYFFESALKRNRSLAADCILSDLGVDYISRLCGLKLVSKGDVTLQNPPEKPSAPGRDVACDIAAGIAGGMAAAGGNTGNTDQFAGVAGRLLAESMDAFREELGGMIRSTDLPGIKRSYQEMINGFEKIKGDNIRLIMAMDEITRGLRRDDRVLSRPVSPRRPSSAPAAAPPAFTVPPAFAGPPAAVPPPPAGPPAAVPPPPAGPPPATVPPSADLSPKRPTGREVPTRVPRATLPRSDDVVDDALARAAGPDDPADAARGLIDRFGT